MTSDLARLDGCSLDQATPIATGQAGGGALAPDGTAIDARDPSMTGPERLGWRDRIGILTLILAGSPLSGLVFTAPAPVLPLIAKHFAAFGDGALLAQMVMTISAIGFIAGGPLFGWLYARLGGRRLLLAVLLLYTACGASGLVIASPWLLLASRALIGLLACGCQTTAVSIIGERFSGAFRARLIGMTTGAAAAIAVVSLIGAGALGQRYGWRAPFTLYLAPLVLFVLAMWAVKGADRNPTERPVEEAVSGQSVMKLWWIYLLMAVVAIPLNMPAVQIGFQLASDGVTNSSAISWVIAVNSLMLSVAALSYGQVRGWIGPRFTFASGLALIGAGFVGIGMAHGAIPTASACVVSGLGAGLLNPHFSVLLLERVSEAARSRAVGLLYSAFFIGDFLNPLVAVPLRTALGVHGAFMAVGWLLAACGLAVALVAALRHR